MGPIDLNRIRDFLHIVELGNISRAAEALGVRKAKLSRNLALLERELGVQLVYRTTRQFRLTTTGSLFYQQMREHIGKADDAITRLATPEELIAGHIRLTAPEDMGHQVITGLVSAFNKLHPQVSFELIYTNEILDLVKLGIDVAFRAGQLKDSSILQRRIGSVEFILVAAPSYLEKSKKISSPDDLAEHATIVFAPGATQKHIWRVSNGSARKAVAIQPRFVANNFLTIRDLALDGRGLAYLPRFIAHQGLTRGDFTQVLKQWSYEGAPVHIVLPGQKNVAPWIRKFFDYAINHFN